MAAKAGWFVIFNHIPELIAAVEANSKAQVKRKADDILRDAKGRIHRLTGDLQDTAYTNSVESGKSAEIVFPSDHAAPLEYGTYKMAARPYLSPAMVAHEDDFFSSIGGIEKLL